MAKRKQKSTLFRVRVLLQVITFPLLTLLFLDFTGTLHAYLGWLAKLQFLPAVLALNVAAIALTLVLTLLFGRLYCSVICPLGILQDLIAALHNRRKRNRYNYSPAKRWLRYGVLVLFVVALAAGLGSVAALLEPYSAYGRIMGSLLQPLYIAANNVLAGIAEHFDSYAFYEQDLWLKSLPTLLVAVATLVVVGLLAWRGGRSYCNTICPVGTFLSLFARFSLFKVRIDGDKCVKCGLCARNCKASAIDFLSGSVDYSRCVACGTCLNHCQKDALHYAPALRPTSGGDGKDPADTTAQTTTKPQSCPDREALSGDASSRRSFLLAAAIATTTAAMAQEKKKVDGGLAKIADKQIPKRHTPIAPPGSNSMSHLVGHCTACQLCVSACPNGVLRPSDTLDRLMKPEMSFERGYCRPECTRCGEVCPTGAIEPLTKADKSATHLGHAVWIKKNCVVLTDDVDCGNCARHCPTGAIEMVPLDPNNEEGRYIPSVNEAACIGCGACENLCPARPLSAIYVEGHEVHTVS